jgi:hypothetical protein
MSRKTIELGLNVAVQMPTIPNFIKTEFDGREAIIPIFHVSEANLRKIGEAWTEALVAQAQKLKLKSQQQQEGGSHG